VVVYKEHQAVALVIRKWFLEQKHADNPLVDYLWLFHNQQFSGYALVSVWDQYVVDPIRFYR